MTATRNTSVPFNEKLRTAQRTNNSLLCIGLDIDAASVPASLRGADDPQFAFNRAIIEATADLVCAYKLNISFYESAGETGWSTVHNTLSVIPDHIITIGDGKRGDIANSSERQAHLFCSDWQFDASTVNPYMGTDSVSPFLENPAQCAFVLALTSNPGAKDFQYLNVNGKPLYEHVVARAKKWNTKKNVGLVVGATRPRELAHIRDLVPTMPLLIPGIGAQKGNLEQTVRYGCDRHGELAVINVGRAIINASRETDFAEKARAAAISFRDQMNRFREKHFM